MAELIVVGFKGTKRAAEVLGQVRQLNERWKMDLEDAVAVYRTENGTLRVDESIQPTEKEGAAGGALLGGLIGALLAAPFTAGASVPAAAAALGLGGATMGAMLGGVVGGTEAADWKDVYGISEDFVKEVGGMVQRGQSAVFVLGRAHNPGEVSDQFAGYGGRVLRTTLSKEAAAKFQNTLNARNIVGKH